ncbi:hypothetical protein H1235_11085 [Pseudoxanthomonas sp. NC8]|nr:hypothetical protein H1235_11085 [Pseudoxanthomonas sp. NC8]
MHWLPAATDGSLLQKPALQPLGIATHSRPWLPWRQGGRLTGQYVVTLDPTFATESRWRTLAGIGVLALWAGWMAAAPVAMRRPAQDLPADAVLAALHDRLPPGTDTSAPIAIRLPAGCACPGDDASWNQLSQAMQPQHGTSVTLDRPVAPLAGHDVVILGPGATCATQARCSLIRSCVGPA